MMEQITPITTIKELQAEIAQLQAEIALLQEEKVDLEMLLENTTEHSTYIEAELELTVKALQEERQNLRQEQKKSERLLLNILPEAIASRLKEHEEAIADSFVEATVLFADIVSFTTISSQMEAEVLVKWLNDIFSGFDYLTEKHGLEKIKTIGDAYMVVGGVPNVRTDHVEAVAEMALDMQKLISQKLAPDGEPMAMRIGIHTGRVVAGVIGTKKFTYDLWGDTVNTASRMESQGIPGSIQVSEVTFQRLKPLYEFEKRGLIQIKGKTEMLTYILKGRQNL
jgi:class 3 adenylate cyclase